VEVDSQERPLSFAEELTGEFGSFQNMNEYTENGEN
jgi:hypothetical protein